MQLIRPRHPLHSRRLTTAPRSLDPRIAQCSPTSTRDRLRYWDVTLAQWLGLVCHSITTILQQLRIALTQAAPPKHLRERWPWERGVPCTVARKRGETRTVQPSGPTQARRTQVRPQACGALRGRNVRSNVRSVSTDEVHRNERGGGRGSAEGHVCDAYLDNISSKAGPKRRRCE